MANTSTNKFKKEKYQEALVNRINSILRTQISDSRLTFVSITKVELNRDYSCAKVYWDTFDMKSRGDAKTAIVGTSGKIRSLLAKSIKARHTPVLDFVYDSQFDSEQAITELIQS